MSAHERARLRILQVIADAPDLSSAAQEGVREHIDQILNDYWRETLKEAIQLLDKA